MFFRISSISATRSHAGLFFRIVNKTLGHFSGLGVEIAFGHHHVEKTLNFSGETNTAIHGLNDDVTATA